MIELNEREKRLLLIAMVILLPLILYRVALSPFIHAEQRLQQRIDQLKIELVQINSLGRSIALAKRQEAASSNPLSLRIEKILSKWEMMEQAQITTQGMDRGQKLAIRLDNIDLSTLTSLLYEIEHSMPVILIETIDLTPSFKNESLFQANFALSGP